MRQILLISASTAILFAACPIAFSQTLSAGGFTVNSTPSLSGTLTLVGAGPDFTYDIPDPSPDGTVFYVGPGCYRWIENGGGAKGEIKWFNGCWFFAITYPYVSDPYKLTLQ